MAAVTLKDLYRWNGLSEVSCYLQRSKSGEMSVSDAERLKDLETGNARLEKLLAEQLFENDMTTDTLRIAAGHQPVVS